MDILQNTRIDFMKYRKVFVWVSVFFIVVGAIEIFFVTGINLGIDFAGGTQVTVRFRDDVDADRLRRALEDAGVAKAQIQRYGEANSREFLVKLPVAGEAEAGREGEVDAALDASFNPGVTTEVDLNQKGRDAVAADIAGFGLPGLGTKEEAAEVAGRIISKREELGIFSSWDEVGAVPGVDAALKSALESRFKLGAFHVIQVESVGPTIGSELKDKALAASVLSLLAMLVYIWWRFELRFGIGALVASFHDVWVTLGLYTLAGYEFNLPTIAAFLTLVGYSVNDTVVIFDRVRENMRRHRRKPLVDVMNDSLNQTLSRTILTSGTTLLAVGSLFFFGGEVIRGFAFVMLVGVIVGTYSSVYVASPFTLLWEQVVTPRLAKRGPVRRAAEGEAETSGAVL